MKVTSDLRFAILPEWLIDHPDITPIALRVFAVLARYADKDTDEARRSRQTIADRARCSLTHLDRALLLLRQAGAVTWEHQYDSRGPAPSAYQLHFIPGGFSPPVVVPLPAGGGTSSIDSSIGGDTSEQVSPAAGVSTCPQAGCDRGAEHAGPHRDPWWEAIAQATYPGEQIPEQHEKLAGKLAARARKAGHPPERILEAAAWIHDHWGADRLTLPSLVQNYERASGELARNSEQVRRQLGQALRAGKKPVVSHVHVWQPHFKIPGLEVCPCGERRTP